MPPVVDEKSSHVLAKPNIPLSKGLGAQVRNMSVSSKSIFQCDHHDILAFSVSYMSINKNSAVHGPSHEALFQTLYDR